MKPKTQGLCCVKAIAITALLLGAGLPVLAQSKAQPEGAELAARRATHMNAGVNLSGWLGWSGEFNEERFASYTNANDLKLLHELGFESVRLCFNPAAYLKLPVHGPQRQEFLKNIHRAVDMILANGLNVTLTVFPGDEYKRQLVASDGWDDNKVEDFAELWRELAESFATSDPERVFFELMNEPEQQDSYRWVGIESKAVHAIRSVAPLHTVVATGGHYSGLEDLLRTEPLDDANVVYTFHFYEPFFFTHQGATWTSRDVVGLKGIPYPTDEAAIEKLLPGIADDVVRLRLYNFGTERWDAQTISGRIAFAAAWGRERHVTVICNEFGAFKDTVPSAARARYLHDVRTALEAEHIPWTTWDYRGNFGVVDRTEERIVPDDVVLGALGRKTGVAPVELKAAGEKAAGPVAGQAAAPAAKP